MKTRRKHKSKKSRRVILDALVAELLAAPARLRKRTLAAHAALMRTRTSARPTIRVRRVAAVCGNTITLRITAT